MRLIGRVDGLSILCILVLGGAGAGWSNSKTSGSYIAVLIAVVCVVALGLRLSTASVVVVSLCSARLSVRLLVHSCWRMAVRGRAVWCRVGGIWILVSLPPFN